MHDANLTIRTVTDRASWDARVNELGGHPLQLWGWGEVKATGAWTPHRVEAVDGDGRVRGLAQVLVRSLPAQFKALCHVPRGPVIAPAGDGWGAGPGVGDDATRDAEIASYTARAEAEAAAEQEPDDASAERTRLEAPDVSPLQPLRTT